MRGWEHVTPYDLHRRLTRPIGTASLPRGEEIAATVGKSAPSKYRNVRTTVDGWTFDSRREADRYQVLLMRGRAGLLRNLELQPSFVLVVAGVKVGVWRGDFRYEVLAGGVWVSVVEDVKGFLTPVYRLKKRIVEALYGFKIQEIR